MTDASAREVDVSHLGRMGEGVVETGTREPIYVAGALPGERVRIGAPRREGRIVRAPLLEVVTPSPARVVPACTVVARCGGCPLAHLARGAQLESKRDGLALALRAKGIDVEALGGQGSNETAGIELVLPEPARAYRVRARLAWSRRGRLAAIGYRAGAAHTVVAPERCEVLAPSLEQARTTISPRLAPYLAGDGDLHLALTDTEDGVGVVLGLASGAPQPPALYAALDALVRERVVVGVRHTLGGASVATTTGDARERSLDVDGRRLSAGIGAFRQGHAAAREALGGRVVRWGRPEDAHVVELHAGHGHFTLALAARAASTIAVELDADAARALRENLAAHDLRADVRADDAARALASLTRDVTAKRRPRPDLVVLDPPRTGASEVMPSLASLAPARIVYVSCDPGTFARDAAMLAPAATLRRLALVDLFPDTLHVELVALFERQA